MSPYSGDNRTSDMMERIMKQFSSHMKQLRLPKIIVINGIEFDVNKGIDCSINNQGGHLQETNFLQRTQEYTLVNKKYEITIPIVIQLYFNTNNHYRLFVYTKGNKMLTSINLTNNFQDNKIQLSIPLKLSTQKIEGRDMTKAEREMYRDLLIEHVQKEGIDLDGRTAYLGTYSTLLQRITYPTGEKFLENLIKLAILTGHFAKNKHYTLPNIIYLNYSL